MSDYYAFKRKRSNPREFFQWPLKRRISVKRILRDSYGARRHIGPHGGAPGSAWQEPGNAAGALIGLAGRLSNRSRSAA
jgi:hypothetical protein